MYDENLGVWFSTNGLKTRKMTSIHSRLEFMDFKIFVIFSEMLKWILSQKLVMIRRKKKKLVMNSIYIFTRNAHVSETMLTFIWTKSVLYM